MSRKRRNARRAARRLLVEHLEQRRVLDAQLGELAEMPIPDKSDLAMTEQIAPLELAAEGESELLGTFQTVDEIKIFLAEDAEQRWGHLFGTSTWGRAWMDFEYDTLARPVFLAEMASVAFSGDSDFSQTNVQVAGVDEGDIVETDGRYLYLNGDREIVIVDTASDSGLQVVSRVELEGQPRAIYLTEDRLSIISDASPAYPQAVPILSDANWYRPWDTSSEVILTVVDVADPAAPLLVSQTQIDGDLVDSRLIGDTLYLVSSEAFFLPSPETICLDSTNGTAKNAVTVDPNSDALMLTRLAYSPWHGESCTYETREQYWDRLGDNWLDAVLPHYTSLDANGDVAASGLLNSPLHTYRPLTEGAQRLVSISAIEVSADAPTIVTSTAAPLNWTSELYVSQQNLYVVAQDLTTWSEGPSSSIYKFSLDVSDQGIDLAAVGHVPGRVLDQFSLDEHEGLLRIVTQQGNRATAVSGLYVLEQTGDSLETVGQLEDLAPGERLYSVRFVGERAFVVTFGPTSGVWYDPLFTIDVSDPTAPQVQGELEIPGFSNYLQLIDGDFLLGLGRNADATNGRSLEPQVSLFDVSDFDNPQLDGRLSFGDSSRSWSDAFNEHMAVSFFPETGILAIPMNTGPSWGFDDIVIWPDDTFAPRIRQTQYDLFVFQIDVTDASAPIRHLGTIEHESAVTRSLRIADRLVSISRDTIRVHEILNPDAELDSLYYGHRAKDDRFTAGHDSQGNSLDILRNDAIDADADSWTISVGGTTDQGGIVSVDADGRSVNYTPPDAFFGSDSFSYVITNADGDGDEATVTIDVRISVDEDSQDNRLNLFAGMEVGSAEHLEILSAESLTWGNEIPITDDGKEVLYSPSPNAYGTDRIRYEIHNAASGVTSEHTVNIQVRNVNDDPLALDDQFALEGPGEQDGHPLYLLRNDRCDPDPYESLTISSVGPTTGGGTVSIAPDGRSVWYKNESAPPLHDTFTYVVSDGNGGTAEATVTIDLNRSTQQIAQRMTDLAKIDLADRLDIQVGVIDVASIEPAGWNNGCLGLGDAGEPCTQAIVSGFKITLAHEDVRYVYHTDKWNTAMFAESYEVEPQMRIRLEPVDQNGNVLTDAQAGESFTVNLYVKDLRDNASGVFAAYVDVFYSGRMLDVDGEVSFDGVYVNGRAEGQNLPGLIDEVGAFGPTHYLDGAERLLASIPFVALRGGLASLMLNPGDTVGSDALLYDRNEPIPWDQVELIGAEIQIEGTWQNVEQPTDINDDGVTTPLDVLQCVIALNREGSRPLASFASEIDMPVFVDVNGDRDLTPTDVLLIVGELNSDEFRLGLQPPRVRPLADWVDWQALEAEFRQDRWAPIAGVGLDRQDMVDLSHEILADLDRDRVPFDRTNDWTPRGVEQIHTALVGIRPPLTGGAAHRLTEAAEDLQATLDELDLSAFLPDLQLDFDWAVARDTVRDQFFARVFLKPRSWRT
jgi:inhibitor of cysteine peptidase